MGQKLKKNIYFARVSQRHVCMQNYDLKGSYYKVRYNNNMKKGCAMVDCHLFSKGGG